MGHHRHDVIVKLAAQLDEDLQTDMTDVAVTHENDAHIYPGKRKFFRA